MGLWLNAMLYYFENYTAIEDIFKGFDRSELSSIRAVKELFSHSLSGYLAYIKSNFGAISSSITYLEAVCEELCDYLELVQDAEHQIGQLHDKVAERRPNLKTCHSKIMVIQHISTKQQLPNLL
jgi:hypothetical protein